MDKKKISIEKCSGKNHFGRSGQYLEIGRSSWWMVILPKKMKWDKKTRVVMETRIINEKWGVQRRFEGEQKHNLAQEVIQKINRIPHDNVQIDKKLKEM